MYKLILVGLMVAVSGCATYPELVDESGKHVAPYGPTHVVPALDKFGADRFGREYVMRHDSVCYYNGNRKITKCEVYDKFKHSYDPRFGGRAVRTSEVRK